MRPVPAVQTDAATFRKLKVLCQSNRVLQMALTMICPTYGKVTGTRLLDQTAILLL